MSDWDRQRDIDAEGQRAAAFYAERDKRAQPGTLPSHHGRDRLIGVSPEGRPVNNVTKENRLHVYAREPYIPVHLLSEDEQTTITVVWMLNTRERPDIVLFNGKPYTVVRTHPVAYYRECLVLEAMQHKPENPPNEETLV